MAITIDTGITQYFQYGTSGTADTYAGRVISGELRSDNNRVWRPSIQGEHAAGRGIWNGGGRATIEVANVTMLNYALRTNYGIPAMTPLSFEGGVLTASRGFLQTGCLINSLEVEVAAGEALQATVEWLATDQAVDTSPTTAAPSATHWEWYHGECTFDNATLHAQRMRLSLTNNLTPISSVDDKSTNTWVLPEDFIIGNEEVSLTIELLEYPGDDDWELHKDTDVTGGSALIQCGDGTNTISFTLSNLAGSAVRMPLQASDEPVIWVLDLTAKPNASDSLVINYSS